MSDSKTLTDKTLARLRAAATGNGIAPDSIELVESHEETYTVPASLTLTPQLDITTAMVQGRVKGKGRRIYASFDEMASEVKTIEADHKQNASWLDEAVEELEKTEGHGWGQSAALLKWSDQVIRLAATENCPTCRGTAQYPCPECKGLTTVFCHYCEGRGQELCTLCIGTGKNPQNPQEKCYMCNGTSYSLCRFCQGTGKMPCTSCKGLGHRPCPDCKGTGCISSEATITKGARIDFALGSTSGLPSGLLRVMSRLGNERLAKGLVDITLKPPTSAADDKKKPLDQAILALEAKIPYADIKVRFGKKGALISCFGKQARLSGIPPFLDAGLSPARKILSEAATGYRHVEAALKARAMKDALDLTLAGKTHPNELRRLYPIGLSGEVAQEIMKNMALVLRRTTERTRQLVGGAALLASIGGFAGLFLTPLFAALHTAANPAVALVFKIVFPLTVLAIVWFVFMHSAKASLRRHFPQTKIAATQSIGRTGYGAMGLILFAYIIILFMSGQLL